MAVSEKKRRYKLWYMIISLIIAIIIWVLVTYATNIDITKTVHINNVEYSGEIILRNKDLVIVRSGTVPSVRAKLVGKRSDLVSHIDSVSIEVDVSGIDESGEFELPYTVNAPNLYVHSRTPETVSVKVDEYKEKELNVNIKQTGTNRTFFVKSVPDLDKIKISGAASDIDAVSEAYAQIDISELSEDGEIQAKIILADESGSPITQNRSIKSTAAVVRVHNFLYNIVEIPITAELAPSLRGQHELDLENTKLEPDKIEIGVREGTDFTSVSAVVTSATDKEQTCKLSIQDGMYIPNDNTEIKVTPAFKSTAP